MHLISSRYDNEWSTWRKTSGFYAGNDDETLELASDEEINSIAGSSNNRDGSTFSLQAETSTGRSWGPHGNHKSYGDYISLRSFPATNHGLKLNYISGNETRDKYILRWLRQYNQRKTKTFICFSTEDGKKNIIPDLIPSIAMKISR